MHMKNLPAKAALIACALGAIAPALADDDNDRDFDAATIAVYGDAPYGCKAAGTDTGPGSPGGCVGPDTLDGPNPQDTRQIQATPAFIDAINADPRVRLVMHAGDIHSGSNFCTFGYNSIIAKLWEQYKDPLVYTPGDNEWADCHKKNEGSNRQDSHGNFVDYAAGNPVANLALVRAMFFPKAGETLGKRKMKVASQALEFDPAHPTDAEYVENVMWEQSRVLFVTLNIPGGSNNDDDNWFGTATKTEMQLQEIAQRTAADLRWLDKAFARAQANGAKAVLIMAQADMWDLDGNIPSHIANYEVLLDRIAADTLAFGKPVLLINGDSHVYRSDNPLKANQPCAFENGPSVTPCADDAWFNHVGKGYNVPNFHRLVVHGSTFPLEYVRLTVDPRNNHSASENTFGPFSWERVIP